jgi:DNA polymerase-3 subunit gamma/tau
MAFYHKYRPQRFQDLELTQADAAAFIASSVLRKSVGHAYLFTGTHGTGKTSSARILAKAINCVKYSQFAALSKIPPDKHELFAKCVVPCNECDNCIAITNGTFLDVLEMDAASNRGIDEIRDLKEKVRLSPVLGLSKVYIIDEVHMLTTEAFNALLKTLEEPPQQCTFILCTTELHKVPSTIQSRCVQVSFTRPGTKEITSYLRYICQTERITIDEVSLESIVRLSGGAFRDAAKLLEQAALATDTITAETLDTVFSGTQISTFEHFFQLFSTRDLKGLVVFISELENKGANFSYLIKEIIGYARLLLLDTAGVAQDIPSAVREAATRATPEQLLEMIDLLMKALSQQKSSPLPSLPLELACFKLFSSYGAPANVKAPVVAAQKKSTAAAAVSQKNEPKPSETDVVVPPPKPEKLIPPPIENPTLDIMQERWPEVVRLIKKYNASVAALLTKCKIVAFENKFVTLETLNSFQKDMIENPKKRDLIEQCIYELTGLQIHVKCLLGNTKITSKMVENVQTVVDEDLAAVAMEIFGT